MERLTEKSPTGANCIPLKQAVMGVGLPKWKICETSWLEQRLEGDAADRLAAYEDTELMPDEVAKLSAAEKEDRIVPKEFKSLFVTFSEEHTCMADELEIPAEIQDCSKGCWRCIVDGLNSLQSKNEPSKPISDDLVPPNTSDADMVTSTVRRIDGYVRNFKGLSTDQWRRIKAILDEGEKHETD